MKFRIEICCRVYLKYDTKAPGMYDAQSIGNLGNIINFWNRIFPKLLFLKIIVYPDLFVPAASSVADYCVFSWRKSTRFQLTFIYTEEKKWPHRFPPVVTSK